MGKHHTEADDAPTAADLFGKIDEARPYGDNTPYLIDEFGEPIPQRLHGCPECGTTVNAGARSCWQCSATFTPVYELPPAGSDLSGR